MERGWRTLFCELALLDGAQACIDGAVAVGMTGVLVDPLDKLPAFSRARRLLGLT